MNRSASQNTASSNPSEREHHLPDENVFTSMVRAIKNYEKIWIRNKKRWIKKQEKRFALLPDAGRQPVSANTGHKSFQNRIRSVIGGGSKEIDQSWKPVHSPMENDPPAKEKKNK